MSFVPSLARRAALPALAAALALTGCASTRLEAQWADPAVARAGMLRGARVLVACEAYDVTLMRLCEDRLADELTARGATPVRSTQPAPPDPGRPQADDLYMLAARVQQASAAWVVNLARTDVTPAYGPTVSFGLGGWNWGGGGSSAGGGVGVSMPVGGVTPQSAFTASGRLIEAQNGRLAWSARASTGSSSDAGLQLGELARALGDSAVKAGLF